MKRKQKPPLSKIIKMDGRPYYKYGIIWLRVKLSPAKIEKRWDNSFVFWDVFHYFAGTKSMITEKLNEIYGEQVAIHYKEQASMNEIERLNKLEQQLITKYYQ